MQFDFFSRISRAPACVGRFSEYMYINVDITCIYIYSHLVCIMYNIYNIHVYTLLHLLIMMYTHIICLLVIVNI